MRLSGYFKLIRVNKLSDSNLFVIFLLLIGLISRFFRIGQESLWLDEASSIYFSMNTSFNEVISYLQSGMWNDPHPIFYYFLLHNWIKVFGTSEVAVRSLSAIFGILIIILTYYAGKKFINNNTGIIASILVLVNYTNIWYSQEARMYTLTSMLILFSTCLCYMFLSMNKFRYFILYIVSALILIYTDYIGLIVISVHFLFGLINILIQSDTKSLYKILFAYIIIILLYIPWIPSLLNTVSAEKWLWMNTLTLDEAFDALIFIIGIVPNDIKLIIPFMPKLLIDIIILIVFAVLVIGIMRSLLEMTKFSSLIAMICIIPSMMFLISLYVTPIYSTRQISPFVPEIALILAIGLVRIRYVPFDFLYPPKFYINNLYLVLLIMLILCNSVSVYLMYTNENKENWRDLAEYVGEHVHEEDIILINTMGCVRPFSYYFSTNVSSPAIYGVLNTDDAKSKLQEHQRIWLILSHARITEDEFSEFVADVWHGCFEPMRISRYRGIILIRYDQVEPVHLESVLVPADNPDPIFTDMVLEAGQDYLIRASGTCSIWGGKTDGVDAHYCYAQWRVGDTPSAWKVLLLNDKTMYDIGRENNFPVEYNEDHIYQIKLAGNGETLKLQNADAKKGSWADNYGIFTVEIFQLKSRNQTGGSKAI